jgi:hypothetical protein
MTQAQREPRSAPEAWEQIRQLESRQKARDIKERRARQLYSPNEGGSLGGTNDYVACVYLDEASNPTRRFQVGKPHKKGEGDYTVKGGGPYVVDLEAGTCTCPSFVGSPEKTLPNGKVLPAREGDGECKHRLGTMIWLAEATYELVSIKDITDRKRIKWLSAP